MKKENSLRETPLFMLFARLNLACYYLVVCFGVLFVVVLLYCAAKVHGRKQREHIRLQQRYEKLQEVHEHRKGNRNRANSEAFENKDQREQAQDNDVARRDVGEKSHH